MIMMLKMHEVREFRVNQAEGLNDSVFISVIAVIIFCIHRKNAANILHIYRISTGIWQNRVRHLVSSQEVELLDFVG